ncbi:MAG: cation diffusion facilitator family transporter [Bacteroidetes bacterium]|nr:cation diffusion facilitator family transporter [Bacteroidota bacterium]
MVAEKRRVALTSVVAAVFLTGMKLFVGIWTGSLGILSEALHSGLDLMAATITFFAIRVADRPPDEDHQFGHGKVENLSALFETFLLFITCIWILYEAWERLTGEAVHIEVNFWAFAVIIVSIIIDFSRSRALMRIARKYDSQALEADALHFSTDIYSSLVVLVGLISVMTGFPEADAIAAAIVALIVIGVSIRLGRRTIDGLLDRVPPGIQQSVEHIVGEINGVESIRKLRIRPSGGTVFINLVIGIQRTTFFDRAHGIVDDVEDAVRTVHPRADLIVHAEPVIGVREKLADKIEWLVRQSGLTSHNVTILWVNDRYHIEFDIEYPQGTTFVEAHEIASHVENRIMAELPNVADVRIHLEADSTIVLPARDVTTREADLVRRCSEFITDHGRRITVQTVSIYEEEAGLKVSCTIGLPSELRLQEMHAIVDQIEHVIKGSDPRITDVFIHAEPAG